MFNNRLLGGTQLTALGFFPFFPFFFVFVDFFGVNVLAVAGLRLSIIRQPALMSRCEMNLPLPLGLA